MDAIAVARRLYDGFDARDPKAIRESMADDFVGQVSAGMPLGVGGRHEGPDAMLNDCWLPVFAAYDVRLDVDRYLPNGDDVVIAIGHYRGTERASERPFEARFAHVLVVRPDGISALEQITDTRRWVVS